MFVVVQEFNIFSTLLGDVITKCRSSQYDEIYRRFLPRTGDI